MLLEVAVRAAADRAHDLAHGDLGGLDRRGGERGADDHHAAGAAHELGHEGAARARLDVLEAVARDRGIEGGAPEGELGAVRRHGRARLRPRLDDRHLHAVVDEVPQDAGPAANVDHAVAARPTGGRARARDDAGDGVAAGEQVEGMIVGRRAHGEGLAYRTAAAKPVQRPSRSRSCGVKRAL